MTKKQENEAAKKEFFFLQLLKCVRMREALESPLTYPQLWAISSHPEAEWRCWPIQRSYFLTLSHTYKKKARTNTNTHKYTWEFTLESYHNSLYKFCADRTPIGELLHHRVVPWLQLTATVPSGRVHPRQVRRVNKRLSDHLY